MLPSTQEEARSGKQPTNQQNTGSLALGARVESLRLLGQLKTEVENFRNERATVGKARVYI